jgi:predicted phage tail protein
MRTVYLHGKLGKRFGKKWRLSVSSAQEAISAIDANQEGFIDYILTHSLKGVTRQN